MDIEQLLSRPVDIFAPFQPDEEHAAQVALLLGKLNCSLPVSSIMAAFKEIQKEPVPLNYATMPVLFASLVIRSDRDAFQLILNVQQDLIERNYGTGDVNHFVKAFTCAWYAWEEVKNVPVK